MTPEGMLTQLVLLHALIRQEASSFTQDQLRDLVAEAEDFCNSARYWKDNNA